MRYDTPKRIAKVLSKHLPRSVRSVLEPSVGLGSLLESCLNELSFKVEKVCCIDVDQNSLLVVNEKFGRQLGSKLNTIHADFLVWSEINRSIERYDCVLMNPPFSGKTLVNIKNEFTNNLPRFVPIEIAFIINSLLLMKSNACLLAIVPSSVISSSSTSWFRKKMFEMGSFRFIHELPKKSFPGFESRVYLIVFDKGKRKSNTILLNHDLELPHKMNVSTFKLIENERLDYKFYEASNFIESIKEKFSCLDWKVLRNQANVFRGSVKSPEGPKTSIHSHDSVNGFWNLSSTDKIYKIGNSVNCTQNGDILLKRVGKKSIASINIANYPYSYFCSDCILIIRLKDIKDNLKILFAIRVIYSNNFGEMLLERGTGAPFIRQKELCEIVVPIDLADFYPTQFKKYKTAHRNRNYSKMEEIESIILKTMLLH